MEELMHHLEVGVGAFPTSGSSPFIIVSTELAIPNPCYLKQRSEERVLLEIIELVIELL